LYRHEADHSTAALAWLKSQDTSSPAVLRTELRKPRPFAETVFGDKEQNRIITGYNAHTDYFFIFKEGNAFNSPGGAPQCPKL